MPEIKRGGIAAIPDRIKQAFTPPVDPAELNRFKSIELDELRFKRLWEQMFGLAIQENPDERIVLIDLENFSSDSLFHLNTGVAFPTEDSFDLFSEFALVDDVDDELLERIFGEFNSNPRLHVVQPKGPNVDRPAFLVTDNLGLKYGVLTRVYFSPQAGFQPPKLKTQLVTDKALAGVRQSPTFADSPLNFLHRAVSHAYVTGQSTMLFDQAPFIGSTPRFVPVIPIE